MRISTTTIESFRLFMDPEQEWMPEEELIATIKGEFTPTHPILLGQAFGAVIEQPDRYRIAGGYRIKPRGGDEVFEFGDDVMGPVLALFDRRGVFEAKGTRSYLGHTVVAKADQLLGARVIENKATLGSFDFDKYAASCQWRFLLDIFEASSVTYHVALLSEHTNGVIELRGVESFNLYPYPELRTDCDDLVRDFVSYVEARGLTPYLDRLAYGLEAVA